VIFSEYTTYYRCFGDDIAFITAAHAAVEANASNCSWGVVFMVTEACRPLVKCGRADRLRC